MSDRRNAWRGLTVMVGLGRRSELAVAITMALLIATVAAAAVVAPRALADAEEASLERAVREANDPQRRLAIRLIKTFPHGSAEAPIAPEITAATSAAMVVPDDIAVLYGEPRIVIDSSRFTVGALNSEPTGLPTFLTFRVHPEIEAHSRLVAGRPAGPTDRAVDRLVVFEFELSVVAAELMGWKLGDLVELFADPSDSVTRQYSGGLPDTFVGELVGLRELDAPSDPYWSGDARLHRPVVADTGLGADLFAFGSISPTQLPERPFVVGASGPLFVEQRRDLISEKVSLATVDRTLDGLIALDAATGTVPAGGRPGVVSGLAPVLQSEAEQRVSARFALVMAAVGVIAVALVSLAQFLQAAFARRRGWLLVSRARGASEAQVIVAAFVELAVIASLAIVAGAGIAAVVTGGDGSSTETRLLLGLWAGSVISALAMAAVEARRPVSVSGRVTKPPGSGRWVRLAGWVLLVAALASLISFRRRGVSLDSSAGDPLTVLVTILLPLALVVVMQRVLPHVLRLVARSGLAMGPGRLVGVRRAMSEPDAGVGVIAVLTLALTVAGLGLGVNRSLQAGNEDASWLAVGAPYRIESAVPDVATEIESIDGIRLARAGETRFLFDLAGSSTAVRLFNVETEALAALTAGTVADLGLPDELRDLSDPDVVPVVAARRISSRRVDIGDEYVGVGRMSTVVFRVVEVRDNLFGRSEDWAVVDRATFELAVGERAPIDTLSFAIPDVVAPGADEHRGVR